MGCDEIANQQSAKAYFSGSPQTSDERWWWLGRGSQHLIPGPLFLLRAEPFADLMQSPFAGVQIKVDQASTRHATTTLPAERSAPGCVCGTCVQFRDAHFVRRKHKVG